MQRAKLLYALFVIGILIGCPWYVYGQVHGHFQGILEELRSYGDNRITQVAIPPHAILGSRSLCSMLSTCTYHVAYTSFEAPDALDERLQQRVGVRRLGSSVSETSLYREGTLWYTLLESDAVVTIADSTEYPVQLWQTRYRDDVQRKYFIVYVYSTLDDQFFLVNGEPFTGTIVVLSVSQASRSE